MEVREGDRVMVNLAPFIGAQVASKESIPCRVASTNGGRIEVRTEYPYRNVSLWVAAEWVEPGQDQDSEEELTASLS